MLKGKRKRSVNKDPGEAFSPVKQIKLPEKKWKQIQEDKTLSSAVAIFVGGAWLLEQDDVDCEFPELRDSVLDSLRIFHESGITNPRRYVDDLADRMLQDLVQQVPPESKSAAQKFLRNVKESRKRVKVQRRKIGFHP